MTHSEKAPTAEQLAMARRICAEHDHNKAYQYLNGSRDDYPTMKIALAAIIETTARDEPVVTGELKVTQADESYAYAVEHLPMALREVAANVFVECAPYVLEDMARIANQAADLIEGLHRTARALPGDVGMREKALVDAVRGALECLGKPDGYLPSIGAPKTRALQRAFGAYEPHPTFKGY